MNVIDKILANDRAQSSKIAMVYQGNVLTYSDFAKRTAHLVNVINAADVSDDVCLAIVDPVLFMCCCSALMAAGKRVITICPSDPQKVLEDQTEMFGNPDILHTEEWSHWGECQRDRLDVESNLFLIKKGQQKSLLSGNGLIQFTSGTTGKPKGVYIEQDALVTRVDNWLQTLAFLNSEDKHLCHLPLYHGYGNYCLAFPALFSGAELHFIDLGEHTPKAIHQYIVTEKVTCIYGVPGTYEYLCRSKIPGGLGEQLKMAMVGSMRCPEDVYEKVKDRFGLFLNNCYGTSEVGIACYNRSPETLEEAFFSGEVIKGVSVRSDEDDTLLLSSDGMATCYIGPTGITPIDKWFQTNDLYVQEGNKLKVTGRKDDLVKIQGFGVHLGSVEDSLRACPQIIDVAVISHDTSGTGQLSIMAFIVLKADDNNVAAIRVWIKESLPPHEAPHGIKVVNELPKTPTGKVRKSVLKKELLK